MKRGPKIKDFSAWCDRELEENGFSPNLKESVFRLGLANLLSNSHHMTILERANERFSKKATEASNDYRLDVPADDSADGGRVVVDWGGQPVPRLESWVSDASSGPGFGTEGIAPSQGDNGVRDSIEESPVSD